MLLAVVVVEMVLLHQQETLALVEQVEVGVAVQALLLLLLELLIQVAVAEAAAGLILEQRGKTVRLAVQDLLLLDIRLLKEI
jgi:hypothetical protein